MKRSWVPTLAGDPHAARVRMLRLEIGDIARLGSEAPTARRRNKLMMRRLRAQGRNPLRSRRTVPER
ncbi:MAG TPA: hypothetical protein P5568_12340, partial [Acidobacteriota bacterium]|nr:hypothetical protein [Acidobacteriota bacterium]